MRWVLAFLSILLAPAMALGAGVGTVDYVAGDVSAIREGRVITLQPKAPVYAADTVVTGKRGRVKLSMHDGSSVFIGRNSRISLEQYRSRQGSLISGVFNLLWGKARFVVKKLRGSKSSFSVKTTTVVLGVRGTNFIVSVEKPPGIDPLQPGPVRLPRLPTMTLLEEGKLLIRAVPSGREAMLLPGQIAVITPTGRIDIRPFGQGDRDAMGTNVSGMSGGPDEGGPDVSVPVIVRPPSVIWGSQTIRGAPAAGPSNTITIQVPVGVQPPVIEEQPAK